MGDECIFCKIAKGEIPADKLMEDDEIVAFKDIHPRAPVHIIVIPKLHLATMNDLTRERGELAGKMLVAAAELAKKAGVQESGYRAIINCNRGAGQEVFHLHLHILGGRPLGAMG